MIQPSEYLISLLCLWKANVWLWFRTEKYQIFIRETKKKKKNVHCSWVWTLHWRAIFKRKSSHERAGNDLHAFYFHKVRDRTWEPSASKRVCVCVAVLSLSNIKCRTCASTAAEHKIGKKKVSHGWSGFHSSVHASCHSNWRGLYE